MHALGVDWAPLWVPWARRMQTLAVAHYVAMFLWAPLVCVWLPVYLLSTAVWWLVPLYGLWFAYDRTTPRCGSRRNDWFRRMSVWRHLRDYFPVRLVRTTPLDPARNYVFGCHPHGIVAFGAFANFGTDAGDFARLFPGIRAHLLTLVGQFWFPLRRDYVMLSGACEVSRPSIEFLLRRAGGGQAAVIVVGGAAEALDARPGRVRLNLLRRRGFVRVAVAHGADLVPVFSFGENDLFSQLPNPPGSVLRTFQTRARRLLGFSPPIFHGRGIFNYTFGLLPYRRPVTTVVGKALSVEQHDEPTEEHISAVHAAYVAALVELFEANKRLYGVPEHVHLDIY